MQLYSYSWLSYFVRSKTNILSDLMDIKQSGCATHEFLKSIFLGQLPMHHSLLAYYSSTWNITDEDFKEYRCNHLTLKLSIFFNNTSMSCQKRVSSHPFRNQRKHGEMSPWSLIGSWIVYTNYPLYGESNHNIFKIWNISKMWHAWSSASPHKPLQHSINFLSCRLNGWFNTRWERLHSNLIWRLHWKLVYNN